jgi:hypothetical protein
MMWYRKPIWIARFALLGTLSLLLIAPSSAQMFQQAPVQPSALEQEYMNIQQRLAQVQQKALESQPVLRDRIEAIEELVTRKMREKGYDPGSLMESLLAAEAMMQDPGITDARRREIMQSREVQDAQRTLHEAQQRVGNDSEVQAARKALEDDLLAAMRSADPQTDQLLERLGQIEAEGQRGRR